MWATGTAQLSNPASVTNAAHTLVTGAATVISTCWTRFPISSRNDVSLTGTDAGSAQADNDGSPRNTAIAANTILIFSPLLVCLANWSLGLARRHRGCGCVLRLA